MPHSINGIGTNYVGKKELTTRNGVCEHCGAQTVLSSYDTRLCVILVFIPIVPLGKKRVIDKCASCSRHSVMKLEDYQGFRQETLETLAAAYRQDPGDAGAAVGYNSALFEFHQAEEGLRHLADFMPRFADNAEVQFYAGAVCEQQGRAAEATRYLDRAFELDPDNPDHRRARAMTLLEQGDLWGAGSLLDATPAEHRDPAILLQLAAAHQERGEVQTALDVYRRLLEQHPGLAGDKSFRRAVKAAEKQAPPGTSLLPGRRLPWGRIAAVAGAVAVVAGGAWGIDLYLRNHHELHVVNGFPEEVRLVIDGDRQVNLAASGRQTLELAEGPHRAEVTSPWQESIDFKLERGLEQRFTGEPTAVLNPGGLALVLWQETIYTSGDGGEYDAPLEPYGGRTFLKFDNVDYPFEEFPATVTMKSDQKQVHKSRVSVTPGHPAELYWWFLQAGRAERGLDYLESWIEVAPGDQLASAYGTMALGAGDVARGRGFLEPRLELEPVNVEWHRAYQNLVAPDHRQALAEEYDGHLAGDPDNPDLLYLRGRIDAHPRRAAAFFQRAIDLEPGHANARRGSAYGALSEGDFAAAAQVLRQVADTGDASFELTELYHDALYAAGRFDVLEPRLRAQLEEGIDAVDWDQVLLLFHLLVRRGEPDQPQELVREIRQAEKAAGGEQYLGTWLQAHLLYTEGNWDLLRSHISQPAFPSSFESQMMIWWAVETGDFTALRPGTVDSFDKLLISLAFARDGLDERYEARLAEALKELPESPPVYPRFRELIEGKLAITRENLALMIIEPKIKASLLTALAVRHPGHREYLLGEAARFNYDPGFPHRLLASFQG